MVEMEVESLTNVPSNTLALFFTSYCHNFGLQWEVVVLKGRLLATRVMAVVPLNWKLGLTPGSRHHR